MKSKFILTIMMLSWCGCVHVSQRVPNNFKNLMDCKNRIQKTSKTYVQELTACTPQADAFVRSQETYHLNQVEQLEAFEAIYTIYASQKDRGARGLDEIFSRFDEQHQNREHALKVYRTYLKERDLVRAEEFRQYYPQYRLPRPPQILGSTKEPTPSILQIQTAKNLRIKSWDSVATSILVVAPLLELKAPATLKVLNQIAKAHKSKMAVLIPQDEFLLESIDWILAHNNLNAMLIYRESAFEGIIPQFATLQVYFFKDKTIKYQINDLKSEMEPQFKEGLKAIGLD